MLVCHLSALKHSMVLPHWNPHCDPDKRDGALTWGFPLLAPQPQARLHRSTVHSQCGHQIRSSIMNQA